MESKRQKQVAELIKRNFGPVLQQQGGYIYGDAFVTVTNVKMTPDFGLAKIYVSVYNSEDKVNVLAMIRENIPLLKSELVRRIRKHVRRIPNIDIYLDDTLDEMWRLNQVFDKLHDDDQMGDS